MMPRKRGDFDADSSPPSLIRPDQNDTNFVQRSAHRSTGSIEHTFRFLHLRKGYGKEFIKKEFNSLDYDPCENEIYLNKLQQQNFSVVAVTMMRCYLNFVLVGIFTGIIGAFVNFSTVTLGSFKNRNLSSFVSTCKGGTCLMTVYLVWFGWIFIFVAVGSFIVVFIEPGATGGGIAGVVAFLNGVDLPNILTTRVIIFKTLSMICTCVSGVVGGKEGPMIHVGAAMGAVVVTFPVVCKLCSPFRNDSEMRDLVAAGVASGVAAAFGSPIGGFLLSVEESVSFLNINLLFKIFLSALFSVCTMNLISSIINGFPGSIGNDNLLYLRLIEEDESHYTIYEIPAFLLTGTIAGLVGSLYVYIQKHVHVVRRKYVVKKWKKMFDCLIAVFLTSFSHMVLTYVFTDCGDYEDVGHAVKFNCKDSVNQISMFTLNTGEESLRWFIHAPVDTISLTTALSLFILYFTLAMYTVGMNMAIGIFVPNLLIGAMWGRCVVIIFNRIFPNNTWAGATKYTLLAAAGQLSGTLRITFSVTVIMMEVSGNIHFVLPLMIVLITAKWVGDLLTPPMFEAQVVLSGMPLMFLNPPPFAGEIPIRNVMSKPTVNLKPVITVGEAVITFNTYSYQGFPVVDKTDVLVGLVLAHQILILMKYKMFLGQDIDLDELEIIFNKEFKKQLKLSDLILTERDYTQRINLQIIMNPCPYAVRENMSFDRVYRLFRSLGLRHVLVVDTNYKVVGIVTRKDLCKYHMSNDGIIQLPII